MSKPDFNMTDEDIDRFTSLILQQSKPEYIDSFLADSQYLEYQDDPVGFCEQVLGETLTDDVKAMMESVRDHQVTVAVSGNGTGKSHGAARGSCLVLPLS